MARPRNARNIRRFTVEFKRTAVRLSRMRGVKVGDVAEALAIHPFMLSRWRKESREGKLRPPRAAAPPPIAKRPVVRRKQARPSGPSPAELRRFAALKSRYTMLREEHELLKKAIRFCSERRAMSSRSSIKSGTGSPSGGSARS
jgi:transposase